MAEREKSSGFDWLNLVGPAITVLTVVATMAIGFGAQGATISALSTKVDKLYELLIYPSVARP